MKAKKISSLILISLLPVLMMVVDSSVIPVKGICLVEGGPVSRDIAEPTLEDNVTITANITCIGSSGKVELYYNTSSSPWMVVLMVMVEGTVSTVGMFKGTIPKQEFGVTVYYYVNATGCCNTNISATFSYTVKAGPLDPVIIITILMVTAIPLGILIIGAFYFHAHPEKLSGLSKKLRRVKER